MDSIGWILPLIIISFVINSISKAVKRATSQQNQMPGQMQNSRPDLQQMLRQQIYEHQNPQAKPPVPQFTPENTYSSRGTTLEPSWEGAPLNSSITEGAELNRNTLEGMGLEGISLENAQSPDRITPTEMAGGNSYDFDRRRTTGSRSVRLGNTFLNQQSIVSGVIMSEVLQSRGGRKRTR